MIFNVLEAAKGHQEMVEIIHKTHQIFVGIKGRDIVLLHDNPPGRTDTETFISIPIEDPEADKIFKHEWQHIFFKSNLRARAAFAKAYSESLKKRMPNMNQKGMEEFIHLLVNGLDDIRVCSLWELIYPHSAEQVQNRWKTIIMGSGRYQNDIIMFLMGLGLGLEAGMHRSEWMRYKNVLKDAVDKVVRRGFPTCLLSARWIVESIISDISTMWAAPDGYSVVPPKPAQFIPSSAGVNTGGRLGASRSHAVDPQGFPMPEHEKQSEVMTKLHLGATRPSHHTKSLNSSWNLMDTNQIPEGSDPDWRNTDTMVNAAMGVSNPQQVEIVLRASQLEVDRIIFELKNRTKVLTPGQRLLKGLEGKVHIQPVAPNDVDELMLTVGDQKLVQTLHHSFVRLMDQKKRVTSDSGTTLDPQAYIDFLNGSSNTDMFIEEENAKGFSSMVLLDMSGSMRSKWETVSRACKVIAKAMKFPCSQFTVWGFTSMGDGVATIFDFENPERGYMGPGVKDAWGLTPLHIAVEVAIRRLQSMPGSAQHLIVLTDGYPTHLSASRELMTDTVDLFSEIARHIQSGRKKGVNVVGLISGEEINDTAANIMFGHRRFWERVSEQQEDLFFALVGLAKRAFVGYLRSK